MGNARAMASRDAPDLEGVVLRLCVVSNFPEFPASGPLEMLKTHPPGGGRAWPGWGPGWVLG